jgi:serine/threonine protein kinase
MNENWERVQSLFLQAVDLRPEERVRFLDRACSNDAKVRREVESLLAHDGAGEQHIAEALGDTAQSLFEAENLVGARLGAWRVLHEIGRGGMGTVYLAARDDDQFQKRVALKVVKRGMDTAELLSSFRRERQILAHLDHPYIARLIDGGSTPHGQPFLVMEYVEGKPIDIYCREETLDIEARCRLFLKVCQAVSYAHRKLVIHRDLKPGNILVTADGSPKLLDFGVAKLLDHELDSGSPTILQVGRLLTPEYASPEQVRGEPVGTSSDIYALGAILYEMLTGVKAQSMETYTPGELERVICDTEIAPPSQRIPPADIRLRKRLSGDLDNIVLKSMRKEPEHRYSSVDLFAEDLDHHLRARPVKARRPSLGYRLGKFARRNRLWLAAWSLVAVSMVTGTWAAFREAHRARIEQQRAEARLSQMVELANRALFDVHGSIERLPGATEARQQLVKTTLLYLEKLSNEAGSDERLRKALAAAYFRLGDLQGYPFKPNLGDSAGAITSYQTSAALVDPLRRGHPDDTEAQRLWLETQERLANLLNQRGDSAGASKVLRDALPAAEALEHLPHADVDAQRIQGMYYNLMAEMGSEHDSNMALPYARRYLEIFSRLASRYPDRADFILEQSNGYELVGHILHVSGDSNGALGNHLQCVSLREGLVKAHPNDVVYKRNLMIGYGHVGDMLGSPVANNLGDSEGARVYYHKAVSIGEELHNADPNDRTAMYDLAASLERLGMVDVAASGVPESLTSLQRSAGILEDLMANEPDSLRVKYMLSLTQEYEGRRLQRLGRYTDAITTYRRSITIADSILASDAASRIALSQLVASGRGMAMAMAMAGDRAGAIHQAGENIARAESAVNAGPEKRSRRRYVAESMIELGSVYEILGERSPTSRQKQDWEAARSALVRAIAELESLAAEGKPPTVEVADLQRARKLLADADAHVSASKASSH